MKTKWIHSFNETREKGDSLFIRVKEQEVIIDKEDIDKILPYRVCIAKNGYAYSNHRLISRLVMNNPKGYEVDHINHNTLDNRKNNLRVVTRAENRLNRKCLSNTGELGITLCKNGWYIVAIENKYRGIRRTLDDAIELRNKCLIGTKMGDFNYFLKEGAQVDKEG